MSKLEEFEDFCGEGRQLIDLFKNMRSYSNWMSKQTRVSSSGRHVVMYASKNGESMNPEGLGSVFGGGLANDVDPAEQGQRKSFPKMETTAARSGFPYK